ncbi:MAG: hypothetical protein IKH98_05565 [Candidatus Methanomethylophilaceae archaeon]|nr:hypothetical protein [Candidatus Methanomethylophilaceae archaeon]
MSIAQDQSDSRRCSAGSQDPGLDDGDFRQGGDDGKAVSEELAAPAIP